MSFLKTRSFRAILLTLLTSSWIFYVLSLKSEKQQAPDFYEIKRHNTDEKISRGAIPPRVTNIKDDFEVAAVWSRLNGFLSYRLRIRVDDCLNKLSLGTEVYTGFEIPFCDYNHAHYIPVESKLIKNSSLKIQGIFQNTGGPGGIEFFLTPSASTQLLLNAISFLWLFVILVVLQSLLPKKQRPQAKL